MKTLLFSLIVTLFLTGFTDITLPVLSQVERPVLSQVERSADNQQNAQHVAPAMLRSLRHIPLVINELMASNSSTIHDSQGQYNDWIEIYNSGNVAFDVGGMYLTDDLTVPTKWQIPDATIITAGGYLLIWADNPVPADRRPVESEVEGNTADAGLHANFKLSSAGEEIGLFDTNGSTLIDGITFGQQTADISYGRYPDANDELRFFGTPTPGAENNEGYLGAVTDLEFSHQRGFYDEPFSVTITTETEGAIIYYTLDGSSPYDLARSVAQGTFYTGPISISTTTYLRAVAIKSGFKPTTVVTHTYIFLDDVIEQPQYPPGFPTTGWGHAGPDYQMDPVVTSAYSSTIKDDMKSIPILSLVMDIDDWFGSKGIYINKSQDGTERVVSMEFIDPNNGDEFQINCAISMQGGVSGGGTSLNRWKADKLSMRPRFKTTTDDGAPTGGPTKLNFQVFPNSPIDSFDTLVLDARLGNTWPYGGGTTDSGTRPWISGRSIYQPDVAQYTRDQFVADIQNALGGFGHHGRHVHLYLNGLYWGIYNLHERPDHRFAAAYLGGDADDYDCLKHNSGIIINGSNTSYNQMLSIAESGMASNEKYQLIQQYLDVDNFIDYLIPNYYVGNYDWGHKNWYATRNANDPNGRWRFHHWDGEHMLENLYENVTGRNNVGGPTRIHNRLMQNAEYRLLFADHVHRHFFNDGTLIPEGAAALYHIRLNDVDRAVVVESARWGDNQIDRFAHIRYMRDPHWLLERDWLLGTYIPNRTNIVLDQFRKKRWYPNVDAPVFYINSSYQHGGYISQTDRFSMMASQGTIHYTLDGSDPRLPRTSGETVNSSTLVPASAAKKVLVPSGPVSDNWKDGQAFNDRYWINGSGGVGYETGSGYESLINIDVRGQMYNGNTSCYIRIPFNITENPDSFNFLTLNMQYDDGFIAYINGTEVQRTLFTGTPAWNSQADDNHEAEGAEAFDISGHINILRQGYNILAIHGLNNSATSSDLLVSVELIAGQRSSPAGSGLSPAAVRYTEPITLTKSTHVKSRVLDGSNWSALNEATFALGPVAENLRITEIMYNPFDFAQDRPNTDPNVEYVELTNIGAETINLNLVKFTNGIDFIFGDSELAPQQYILVVRDINAFQVRYGSDLSIAGQYTGSLNNAGERIELQDAIGQTILDFSYSDNWYGITDGEGFSLTIIDPASSDPNSWSQKDAWRPSAYINGSPGWDDSGIIPNPGTVVINELLANSPAGAPDWVELHNTTDEPVSIASWFLSDSGSNPTKYEIADGTTIAAHGYIVFYEDIHFDNTSDPGCHTAFALSDDGETVYLTSAHDGELTGYRQSEDFGASASGVSFGRYYKSSTDNFNFVAMSENTPGLANAYPKVGPIVISEIMYNPSSGNQNEEYIELHNISSEAITLYDSDKDVAWEFTDGIGYIFPSDIPVTIPAGGYLLLVKEPAAFSLAYGDMPAGVEVLGPYDGQLSNSGERIELSMPAEPDGPDSWFYIRMDRVSYSDGSHPQDCPNGVDLWPVEADGRGLSLNRRLAEEYGNDVANWQALSPSPGENGDW